MAKKIITSEWLRRRSACLKARIVFRKMYPNGVTINERSCVRIAKKLGW